MAVDEAVDCGAEGPDVRGACVVGEFGGLVAEGSDAVAGVFLLVGEGGEAEVGEHDVRVRARAGCGRAEEDILRFDVAVEDLREVAALGDGGVAWLGGAAEVDVREGFGEVRQRVPDEAFGDAGVVEDVVFVDFLEGVERAVFVVEFRAHGVVGVVEEVEDAWVRAEYVLQDVGFAGLLVVVGAQDQVRCVEEGLDGDEASGRVVELEEVAVAFTAFTQSAETVHLLVRNTRESVIPLPGCYVAMSPGGTSIDGLDSFGSDICETVGIFNGSFGFIYRVSVMLSRRRTIEPTATRGFGNATGRERLILLAGFVHDDLPFVRLLRLVGLRGRPWGIESLAVECWKR